MSCGSLFGTFSLSLAARIAEGVRFYIFRRFAGRARAGRQFVWHFSPFARGRALVGWSSILHFSSVRSALPCRRGVCSALSPFARGAPLVGWSSFLQFSSFCRACT